MRPSTNRISKMTQNIAEDEYFIKQVHHMLSLKYKYGFMKGAGVILLTLIILMILCSIIFNCNAVSLVLFLNICFLCVKPLSFASLIYINLVMMVILILQYGMALSNLSYRNSPMGFPDPYNDTLRVDRIGIPWYINVPFFNENSNKWAFYFSLMITYNRIMNLWFPGLILLLSNIYFINFYSMIFNQNIDISDEKNIKDVIKIQSDILTKKYEQRYSVLETPKGDDVSGFLIREDSNHPVNETIKFRGVTEAEIDHIINMFYSSSWMVKFYNYSLNVVCSIGGLLTLIFLLIITFDQTGMINFVYIVF